MEMSLVWIVTLLGPPLYLLLVLITQYMVTLIAIKVRPLVAPCIGCLSDCCVLRTSLIFNWWVLFPGIVGIAATAGFLAPEEAQLYSPYMDIGESLFSFFVSLLAYYAYNF